MAEQKLGNPAVVGLAGFGLTTMMLQFHNVGWMGIGPVIWLGLIFGGFAQMVAGLQEMKSGNNFGYCAVHLLRLLLDITGPDSHWQSLQYLRFQQNRHWMVSGRLDCVQHNSLDRIDAYQQRVGADVFTLLMIGFVLLDFAHFGYPELTVVAGYELMACAAMAWYIMAHLIFADLFGRDVLPVGKPWI